MIDRLTTVNIPTQPRTADQEGAPVKQKTEEKPVASSTKEYQEPQLNQAKKKEKVEEVIKGLNDFLEPAHTSLKFKLHEKLNEYYVTIVDDNTNEVVKEIPSKKLLDTYAAMADHLGLLVDKKI